MIETKDYGRLFFARTGVRDDAPLVHYAPLWQAQWPYWQGWTLIFRGNKRRQIADGPGKSAVIIGWWHDKNPQKKYSVHDLLLRPLRGRDLSKRLPRYVGERTAGSNLPGIVNVEGEHAVVPSVGFFPGEPVGDRPAANQEGHQAAPGDADE